MYVTGYCGCEETFSLIMVGIITRCFETTVICFSVLSISRNLECLQETGQTSDFNLSFCWEKEQRSHVS